MSRGSGSEVRLALVLWVPPQWVGEAPWSVQRVRVAIEALAANDNGGDDGIDEDGGDDGGSRCEAPYASDTNTCNGIGRRRGAAAAQRCHASASDRYAACISGKPLPPLNTYNI